MIFHILCFVCKKNRSVGIFSLGKDMNIQDKNKEKNENHVE